MKYMLLKAYRPCANCDTVIWDWAPDEIAAHIDFQRALCAALQESGEFVAAEGLAGPDQVKFVTSDGRRTEVITDGPFVESRELLAGYFIIDVDSEERALEIAAQASAAPGPKGEPIGEYIEVRALMSAPATD